MMRLIEILRISFDSLLRQKMRSLLTMLGIIIGVGAVIAMVAIGQGAQTSVEAQISSLGTNVLMVFPGTTTRGGIMAGAGTGTSLTEEDAQAAKEQCPAVAYVSPLLRSGGQIVYGNVNWGTVLRGGRVDLFSIRDWQGGSGGVFFVPGARAAGTKLRMRQAPAPTAFFY